MDGQLYGFQYERINNNWLTKYNNCVLIAGGWPNLLHKHHTTREMDIVWNCRSFHINQVQYKMKGFPWFHHVHYYPG